MKPHVQMRAHSASMDTLMQASRHEGCPVCTAVGEEMARVMDGWTYEGFSDGLLRQQWRRAQGFCSLHTWQLAEKNTAFQLALVYRDIVEDLLDQEEVAVSARPVAFTQGGWRRWLERWKRVRSRRSHPTAPSAICFFCEHYQQLEQRYGETLVALLDGEEAQDWLAQSTGLCRRHMAQAVCSAQEVSARALEALHNCQQGCLSRLREEIKEQIRKHDYRFLAEPRGNEMTAWRRAAQICAGNQGVYH